jgi:asparagine synthase (glutamine-hydrolysing)
MCGIVGIVSLGAPWELDQGSFARIVRSMSHRGPDAEGMCYRDRFAFGHRRLSIVDLDRRSDQPMSDPEGRVYLTFNGEIYNFKSLRNTLRAQGCTFRTNSDTEVILQAYKIWGEAFVDRLNGMFALGIYDESKDEFFLYRDRIGVKPVYYHVGAKAVYFASELKGVIGQHAVPRRLNFGAVSAFLSYRHVPGNNTYFEDVYSLEPGSYLRVANGRVHVRQYWELNVDRTQRKRTSADDICELIKESVELQSVADVPVAALLSGGLDSSILLYEMSRKTTTDLQCFTGQFRDCDYDESVFAREMAERTGAGWHAVELEPEDLFLNVRSQIRVKDQPLGMHNEVAMYKIARRVSSFAKVVVCGEGADELFAGYGRLFRAPFDLQRIRFARYLPRPVRRRLSVKTKLGLEGGGVDEMEFFLSRYSYFPEREKFSLFTPHARKLIDGDAYTNALLRKFFTDNRQLSFFDRIWLFLVRQHLPGLLGMIDSATMAAGVEARVPFTDHRLVQCAFDLPATAKLRWRSPLALIRALTAPIASFSEDLDETKVVLRRIYQSYLPDSVLHRKKMGFPVPLGKWMLQSHGKAVRDLLFSPNARIQEVLNVPALKAWFDNRVSASSDVFGRQLWQLCNLELFLQEYF